MFLKQMKIIGFKSFVEPTLFFFKSHRTAVVGPNGCGKSNIIDAIRWVMGESSPKFLRGELMSDVIFNGSHHRKALSVASVEIILDNSSDYFHGPYVRKGDVALRREMNRSGESHYFINQQRVRRKDLTDLWLGTGAGARGYAIIGQNMVNQLVEAHPEVLKAYLEEAAGVSKYKERRKESQQRLQDISDNLARIEDMTHELSLSLERLAQQAKDAEIFQSYRQELRIHQEHLQILQARKILEKQHALDLALQQQILLEETLQKEHFQMQNHLEECEQRWLLQQDENRRLEQDFYQKNMTLQQIKERCQQREQDKTRYSKEHFQQQNTIHHLQNEIAVQHIQLQTLQTQLTDLGRQDQKMMEDLDSYRNLHRLREEDVKKLSTQLYQVRQKIHLHATQEQILNIQYEQGLQNLSQVKDKLAELKSQSVSKDLEYLINNQALIEQNIPRLLAEDEELKSQYHQAELSALESMALLDTAEKHLSNTEAHYHQLHRDQLNKEASYQGLLDSRQLDTELPSSAWKNISQWLTTWKIPEPWKKIVDFLWSQFLPQYYSKTAQIDNLFLPLPRNFYALMQNQPVSNKLTSLMEKMQISQIPTGFFAWQKLYLVDTLEEAQHAIMLLEEDESILCQEGVWVGKHWIYYLPLEDDKQQGLATRLSEWQMASQAFDAFQNDYLFAQQQLHQCTANYQACKARLDEKKQNVENSQALLSVEQNKLATLKQHYQYLVKTQIQQQNELEKEEGKYGQYVEKNQSFKEQLAEHQQILNELRQTETSIKLNLEQKQMQLQSVEENHSKAQIHYQENKLLLTKIQTQTAYLEMQLPQLQTQYQQATVRLIELDDLLKPLNEEALQSKKNLELLQQQLEFIQAHIVKANDQLEQMKLERAACNLKLEHSQKKHLQALEKRLQLSAEQTQNLNIYSEVFEKHQGILTQDCQSYSIMDDEKTIQKKIQNIENQLQSLGDVNLLAIRLYQEENQRLQQLILQKNDLQQAVIELTEAIKTLDEDMQKRLEATLLAINHHLTEIFPQLFGGGQAKFVASCDNLLEATVAIEVQAPGKRQHRIQLLSGGEKALTAVALLFAIFSLNPAPFCLLDEVDAALDDANAQRLGQLIEKLSSKVQFVLITHNPLTMDIADELMGVTMQEPGVSRVVSVNMTKALAMVNKE